MNAVEKLPLNNDWIALVFLSILSLLVVVKGLYSDRFKSLLGCFFSKNYFLDYAHDRQELLGLFHMVLFLIQNMILGLFLYLISEETSFFCKKKDFMFIWNTWFSRLFVLGFNTPLQKEYPYFFDFREFLKQAIM